MAHPSGSVVKNSSAMQDIPGLKFRLPGFNTLEKGVASPFQFSGLENSVTEQPGGLQSMGSVKTACNVGDTNSIPGGKLRHLPAHLPDTRQQSPATPARSSA